MHSVRPPTITALTSLQLIGSRLIVVKRRMAIDAWLAPETLAQVTIEAQQATEIEARWLAAARHPGVVRLVRVSTVNSRLETELAGSATLRTLPLGFSQLALVLRSVAATLVDLHGLGLVHANLTLDHVVISHGTAVGPSLCSPAITRADVEPIDDVAALAALVEQAGATVGIRHPAWSETAEALHQTTEATTALRLLDRLSHVRPSRFRPFGSAAGYPGAGAS